ncbi:MAG: membrane protein insertion efficiency factor YidD [Marinilabiliales bacterium]|nr:membrane protein insertion efficiency factor YidD [Marinilabiliales bacterium]
MVRKLLQGVRWLVSQLILLPVYFYRGAISPLTPPSCRHIPTCSRYAIDAVKVHGPLIGFWLATGRLLRCHPWGTAGYDPVPPAGQWRKKRRNQSSPEESAK